MIGIAIASTVARTRDALARRLLRAGVTPNMLTLSALGFSALAAGCLAAGAGAPPGWRLDPRPLDQYAPNAYLLAGGVLLLLCSAGDMLDGATARAGGKATTFGAFLDSTLDRFSDFAVFLGIAFYFAVRSNLSFTLLPMVAIFAGLMISYTRARAEDLIEFCTVGYWQRGERCAAILIAVFACNVPALLVQQALLPLLTVWARIDYTRKVAAGRTPILDPRKSTRTLDKLKLWRYPRGTAAYDIVTAANMGFLILARIPADWDPLGKALGI
ncbi:MAG TPA: CDP-alcohol phosphatidyltransferase family protein [Phycisphaerae bacterium]|nr:CDP-alcohol phosphatidyltransferase family protein [Phycisphaerae bacterium]